MAGQLQGYFVSVSRVTPRLGTQMSSHSRLVDVLGKKRTDGAIRWLGDSISEGRNEVP